MKKLSDSEFQIMKVIWKLEIPTTSARIMENLQTNWKVTTILTFLSRLVKKGFLKYSKKGKENYYSLQITEAEYMQYESLNFLERYQHTSLVSLISNFYTQSEISEKDIEELNTWLESRKKGND